MTTIVIWDNAGAVADAAAQAAFERVTKGGTKAWWRLLFPRLAATDWPAKAAELASAVSALDASSETIYRHAVGGDIDRRPYAGLDAGTELALAVFRSTAALIAERARQEGERQREREAAAKPAAGPAPEGLAGRHGLERTPGAFDRSDDF